MHEAEENYVTPMRQRDRGIPGMPHLSQMPKLQKSASLIQTSWQPVVPIVHTPPNEVEDISTYGDGNAEPSPVETHKKN